MEIRPYLAEAENESAIKFVADLAPQEPTEQGLDRPIPESIFAANRYVPFQK